MSSITLRLGRASADKLDVDYYRSKAASQKYVQSGNEFFRALPYLDPSKVNEVFNQIRESGFIQDFILVNGSEFDVGHSIERSSTISHKDRAVTESVTESNTIPGSIQTAVEPYDYIDLSVFANHWSSDGLNMDWDEDLANNLDMTTFLDDRSADVLQGAIPYQADGATQDVTLPSDVSKVPTIDQATFSYPTPSTIGHSSPSTDIRSPPNLQKRVENGTRRNRKRTTRPLPAMRSNSVIASHMLLRSCVFRKGTKSPEDGKDENDNTEILNDDQIQRVLEAGARLVGNDLCGFLRPQLENWERNQSQNLHALGIPFQWQGIEAAAEYFIKIHSDDILDLVGTRVAPLLLFINYEVMGKRPEEFCSRLRKKGEQKKTLVLNCIVDKIVDKIPGFFGDQSSPKARRDLVNNQIRNGRWWWKLSRWLGLGVLLLGSEDLFRNMRNDTFSNAQIDALRTYASYARPGTIRLLQSLNPIVRTIIFGEVPRDLVYALQSDGSPLFGDFELSYANNEDEAALLNQNPEIPWANAIPENENHEDVLRILCDRAEENF